MDNHFGTRLSFRYNSIARIEQQRSPSKLLFDEERLVQIASLFLKYQAHSEFGIGLLHRHHDLPPGYAMVHTQVEPNVDTCRMEPLGTRQIYPTAYHFVEGCFLPYEFSPECGPSPPKDLLTELAIYVQEQQLSDVFAITLLSPPGKPWVELTTADGMVATRTPEDTAVLVADAIITEWIAGRSEGRVEVRASVRCIEEPAGHRRVK